MKQPVETELQAEIQTDIMPPALLTLKDVAHELRVSLRTAWTLLSSGRLYPADVQLGGRRGRRWTRQRFMAWLDTGGPTTPGYSQMAS